MEKTVGIETPVIRGAEAAATLRAILKASATGRHARGPLLARRLLEYRGVAEQAVHAVGELETSGVATFNKTMNRRLLSMSQILDTVLGVLSAREAAAEQSGGRRALLSPSGTRRLRRRDMLASRIRKKLRMPDERGATVSDSKSPNPNQGDAATADDTSLEEQGAFAGLLKDLRLDDHHRTKRPTFVAKTQKGCKTSDADGMGKARSKMTKRQPCALCLHVFPIESLPSSSTVGEIERMRKTWGKRQRRRLAGEKVTGKTTSSVIEGIRFQMNTEKKMAELGMGIEVLESVTNKTTRGFRAPANRPFSSGAFQVMAVRKPICVLCHNILGRGYDVSGHWEEEGSAIDPPPKPKWLRLHGLKPIKKSMNSSRNKTKTKSEHVEWLEMKELGIYEDEDVSSEDEEEVPVPEEEPTSGEPLSEAQMKEDLEMLLREQQLMLDELRELELARQEVKERKKIVHAKRRDRLRKKARNDSARHLAFFSGRS